MITHKHKLDMVPGGVPVLVHASQYDSSFTIEFTLFARTGELSIPAGATAEIRGTKKDGNAYSAEAAVSGNVVTVTGHQQMTAVKGKQVFEITLYDGDEELSSANFTLFVEPAPMDKDTIPSESIIRELIDVADRAEQIIQAASDAEAYGAGTRDGDPVTSDDPAYENNAPYYLGEVADAKSDALSAIGTAKSEAIDDIEDTLVNVANVFSASTSYSAEDHVLYNGVLYMFNADHAAGAWTGTDVTQVKIGDELTDFKEALDAISVSFDSTNKKIVIEYN